MDENELNRRLFSFIADSPTAYHATAAIARRLSDQGFTKLDEGDPWQPATGGRYFVTRNGALIAFSRGTDEPLRSGIRMLGSHSDSPALKLKPEPRKETGTYRSYRVEKYGGALLGTWFDRDLSVAGRLVFRSEKGVLQSTLVDLQRPVAIIPSLAIHLDRDRSEVSEPNVQNDCPPLLGQILEDQQWSLEQALLEQVAKADPGSEPHELIAADLFCYDVSGGQVIGLNRTLLAAPRLDNLLSCWAATEALVQAPDSVNTLLVCSNHEEVGSRTASGALGSFLEDVLARMLPDPEERAICRHHSFLVSLDNAHADHPNFKEASDPDHPVLLNHGPVIKVNGNQRYCSDASSIAVIRSIAAGAGIPCQTFIMRSNRSCGSTIGPLTSARTGLAAVDLGAPTWGMHSIRETTGRRDPAMLYRLACAFLNQERLQHPRL